MLTHTLTHEHHTVTHERTHIRTHTHTHAYTHSNTCACVHLNSHVHELQVMLAPPHPHLVRLAWLASALWLSSIGSGWSAGVEKVTTGDGVDAVGEREGDGDGDGKGMARADRFIESGTATNSTGQAYNNTMGNNNIKDASIRSQTNTCSTTIHIARIELYQTCDLHHVRMYVCWCAVPVSHRTCDRAVL